MTTILDLCKPSQTVEWAYLRTYKHISTQHAIERNDATGEYAVHGRHPEMPQLQMELQKSRQDAGIQYAIRFMENGFCQGSVESKIIENPEDITGMIGKVNLTIRYPGSVCVLADTLKVMQETWSRTQGRGNQ